MAQHVSSKNLLLSSRPLVVGVPPSLDSLRVFGAGSPAELAAACDLVELRLDQLAATPEELLALTADWPLPLLVTARHPAEGGQGNLDVAARAALLRPFIGRAALMDIELRSLAEMRGLAREAQTAGTAVLGSFHDFERTPSEEVLEGAAAMAEAAGADAVKLATFLNGTEDLARLVLFAGRARRQRAAVMGMGPLGPVSRLTLAKCGSLLNYGYLGPEGNAPGQWPAPRLKAVLAEL